MTVLVSTFVCSDDVCCRTTGVSSRGSCVCVYVYVYVYTVCE